MVRGRYGAMFRLPLEAAACVRGVEGRHRRGHETVKLLGDWVVVVRIEDVLERAIGAVMEGISLRHFASDAAWHSALVTRLEYRLFHDSMMNPLLRLFLPLFYTGRSHT